MLWIPCLVRSTGPDGEVRASLGDPLVDDYLRFVAARSRPNTVLATAYDLKVFFSVVGKEPARVSTTDVMEFLAVQRAPRRGARVVRLEDGESGLSARTLKRRLASVSGLSRTCWSVTMSMCGATRCRAVWARGARWPRERVGCR